MKKQITLNEGQQQGVARLNLAYRNDVKDVVINAGAGYGKTVMLQEFLKQLPSNVNVVATAPFNEATAVLRSNLPETTTCKSTYAALNFVPSKNEEIEFTQRNCNLDETCHILIIDEAGTAPPELIAAAQAQNVMRIWCGHDKQLSYVKKNLSPTDKCVPPIFSMDFPEITLDQPMRNSTEIFEFCKVLEGQVETLGVPPATFNKSPSWLEKTLRHKRVVDDFKDGEAAILAYTNATCDKYNRIVRNNLFGAAASASLFCIGDRVIFPGVSYASLYSIKDRFKAANPLDIAKKFDKVTLFTNTKGVVLSVGFATVGKLNCYELLLEIDQANTPQAVVRVYIPVDLPQYEKVRLAAYHEALYCQDPAKRKKLWEKYHDFLAMFPAILHSYAMTVHRAQGSTRKSVYCMFGDMQQASGNVYLTRRLWFVAASRASKELSVFRDL